MQQTRRAYVHVGPPKTGTSYLQSVLWQSTGALREQGLTVLPAPAGGVPGAQLMYAVRGLLRKRLDTSSADEVLGRFAEAARTAQTPNILVSQEQLSGATEQQAERLHACLPGFEVHLVATARGISRQVPSSWQERVKTRSLLSLDDYTRAVMERSEDARGFWENQDLPDVLHRWGSSLPSERVHVVTVPPSGSAPDLLLARYCEVLGIDHATLSTVTARTNSSLGFVQAEVLRRVNVALGDRLPKPRDGYSRVARWYLAARVLQPQGGDAPLLPRSAEPWCRATALEWIETIRKQGHDVVGDLDDLLPAPGHFATEEQRVGDDQVAESAVEALARILTLRVEDNAETERLKARVAELERQGGTPPRLRRVLARWSSRRTKG
jgi:hypothetical protein